MSINFGHPEATFISFTGRLKLEDCASGMKLSTISAPVMPGMLRFPGSWFTRRNCTDCVNGHIKRQSYSDFINTKNREICDPFANPSPLR